MVYACNQNTARRTSFNIDKHHSNPWPEAFENLNWDAITTPIFPQTNFNTKNNETQLALPASNCGKLVIVKILVVGKGKLTEITRADMIDN